MVFFLSVVCTELVQSTRTHPSKFHIFSRDCGFVVVRRCLWEFAIEMMGMNTKQKRTLCHLRQRMSQRMFVQSKLLHTRKTPSCPHILRLHWCMMAVKSAVGIRTQNNNSALTKNVAKTKETNAAKKKTLVVFTNEVCFSFVQQLPGRERERVREGWCTASAQATATNVRFLFYFL